MDFTRALYEQLSSDAFETRPDLGAVKYHFWVKSEGLQGIRNWWQFLPED